MHDKETLQQLSLLTEAILKSVDSKSESIGFVLGVLILLALLTLIGIIVLLVITFRARQEQKVLTLRNFLTMKDFRRSLERNSNLQARNITEHMPRNSIPDVASTLHTYPSFSTIGEIRSKSVDPKMPTINTSS